MFSAQRFVSLHGFVLANRLLRVQANQQHQRLAASSLRSGPPSLHSMALSRHQSSEACPAQDLLAWHFKQGHQPYLVYSGVRRWHSHLRSTAVQRRPQGVFH